MAAVPWTQTPDFRAATNTTLVPGGPTAYRKYLPSTDTAISDMTAPVVPRRTGNSPQDVTDFHPGQANWSRDNLPNVLYMLESPPARNAFKGTRKPLPKRDQANQIVYERWPEAGQKIRPLRDFKVLPDRIGTKESWVHCTASITSSNDIANNCIVGHRGMEAAGSSNRVAGKFFEAKARVVVGLTFKRIS